MSYWKEFSRLNLSLILEKYQRFLESPESVDEQTRAIFERWGPPEFAESKTAPQQVEGDLQTAVAAANLAQAIRVRGFLAADLDPLGTSSPGDPSLELDYHGLSLDDLARLPAEVIQHSQHLDANDAGEAINKLRQVYSSAIGFDYGHVHQPEERAWLRAAAESRRFYATEDGDSFKNLLARLTDVEAFEHFLHRIYPGKTRFSIEGLDMMVPMLDEIVSGAAESDICMILIGMAHRGRLNVLAHVLGKPYKQIMAEFKDPLSRYPTWDEMGWTGDVKYHKGAERAVEEAEIIELVLRMPPNPSHLEHINPVIAGMARSANSRAEGPGLPVVSPDGALSILIHGDAAFTGEGVVAETLNLSQLPGYHTGGTVHLIANNQLGFTAEPNELRSSWFASDLAKGFEIPVIHVNADHPQACLEAARTALAYRQEFNKDIVIDLIGYRRYGHNEGDEPTFTQPGMYRRIDGHPSVRALWAKELTARGMLSEDQAEAMVQERMEALQQIDRELEAAAELQEPHPAPPPSGAAKRVETKVPLDRLKRLNEALLKIPEDFNLNRKLDRAMRRRAAVFEDPEQASIDWATAEELALATLLQEGVSIRFTGEDVIRGTFSHRHAVFYDTEQPGRTHTPLHHLPNAESFFEIVNSPLTENATIGFEFGYNIQSPKRLVIWEAQYGDFINVAQTMIDEFITSARAKWGQSPSLVLLLPHGNEGQGPDHSSGRLERFLQLAADINLRIANPTTSGQYFHLLRRQAALLQTDPLPLIVFTPKGLLRHPDTAVAAEDLTDRSWRPVLDDPRSERDPENVRRLLLCSGRVFVDLTNADAYDEAADCAIVRLEQLYPFPAEPLKAIIDRYPKVDEIDWVQEEPQNMGAWTFIRPRLEDILPQEVPLHYIGRPRSASPAEGSTQWYRETQQALVERAFTHQSKEELIGSEVIKEKAER